MARKRSKNSKLSYGGLGLTKGEDIKLIKKLSTADNGRPETLAKILRMLVRNWLAE
jgi:hypothetical protein